MKNLITIACFAVSLLISCTKTDYKPVPEISDPLDLTVSLSMSRTKATTSLTEGDVTDLTMFVYNEDGEYLYTSVGTTEDNLSFRFTLKSSDKRRTLVLIANAWTRSPDPGSYLQEAFNFTYYDMQIDGDKIPMFAQVTLDRIDETSVRDIRVTLLRSMARFDVLVNVEDPLAETLVSKGVIPRFELIGCQIYRQVNEAFAMPFDDAYPTNPTVPSWHTRGDITNPTPSELALYEEAQCGVVGKLYCNESEPGNRLNATTIIVTAKFDGNPTYYRINVGDYDNTGSRFMYAPIIRNCKYICNIQSVRAKGFDTVEEALIGEPSNIVYTLINWSNEINGDVVFDGLHHFYAEQRNLVFSRNKNVSRQVSVSSDIPATEWEMSFPNATNGSVEPTKGAIISNNRFRIDKTAKTLTFTTLKTFSNISGSETHNDLFVIKAGALTINFNLSQLNYDTDWGDGGEIIIE